MKARWITPAVTAMNQEGHVDLQGNEQIYESLIAGGMDGILILGSIGEFYGIPWEEKKKMIDYGVGVVGHRVPLYVGTGQMDMDRCIELSNYALEKGAEGVVVISPYYMNLPDSAILNFYHQVADGVKGEILLYNFPDRTGYDLKPELVYELARAHQNIIGIKDTVKDMSHTRELIRRVKTEIPNFQVYSGFDEFFGHNILSGGDGCIAGLSNFAPEAAAACVEAARKEDWGAMCECQRRIDRLMAIYGVGQQFIPIIKMAMVLKGVRMQPFCARPMLPATEEETRKIKEILENSEAGKEKSGTAAGEGETNKN